MSEPALTLTLQLHLGREELLQLLQGGSLKLAGSPTLATGMTVGELNETRPETQVAPARAPKTEKAKGADKKHAAAPYIPNDAKLSYSVPDPTVTLGPPGERPSPEQVQQSRPLTKEEKRPLAERMKQDLADGIISQERFDQLRLEVVSQEQPFTLAQAAWFLRDLNYLRMLHAQRAAQPEAAGA